MSPAPGAGPLLNELSDDGQIAVNADGTISVDWWLRDERGDWQPWMRNSFERS